MQLRFASLLICTTAVALMACSSSPNANVAAETGDEDTSVEPETSTEDTGSPEDTSAIDTNVIDTGTASETPTPETGADTKEVSTTCSTPGATEDEDCGKCGKRARLCNSDGTWLPWGLCTGETGSCVPGESRSTKCGKCGTRMESCSTTCAWDPTVCTGEGLCNANDMEVQYGACSNPKYVKTRTCSSTTCAWGEWSGCVPPKGWIDTTTAPIGGRYYHTAVWSGTEMIVWGGTGSSSYLADGAAYSVATDTWRTLASVPSGFYGRYYHTAVWTGTHMLVWGGYYGSLSPYYRGDGAVYDVAAGTWSLMSTSGAPTARQQHTAVWTGTEMIIWGGYSGSYLADGRAYNPSTNSWRTIAAAPLVGRRQHGALFANGKMVVFGGYGTGGTSGFADGAAYDPIADSWTTLSPPSSDLDARYEPMGAVDPTKKLVAFFGGYYYKGTGGIFDTATGTWKSIGAAPESALPYSKRMYGTTWWAPDGVYVWGGQAQNTSGSTLSASGTGAVFDPTTSTWRAMSDSNALSARYYLTSVWTGAEAIVWGGYNSSLSPYYRNDGKIYRP